MGKFIDKTGQKFNMLTAEKYLGNSMWLCKCDCGNYTTVHSSHLNEDPKRLKIKSCGCLRNKNQPDNENYFSVIDSENKAYVLGFISADGCVQPESKKIKIDLNDSDEDVLIKIQQEIGHHNELSHYHQEIDIGDKHYTSHTSRLVIASEQMVNDLIKYGITANKSNTLEVKLDLISDEYMKGFLRGLIDGDGCISFSPNARTANLTITTSTIMAEQLNKLFTERYDESKFYLVHRNKNNLLNATLQATNKHFIIRVLTDLYETDGIYLNRKYLKYLAYKDYYNTLYSN